MDNISKQEVVSHESRNTKPNIRSVAQAAFETEHVKIQISAYIITADVAKQVVDIEIMKKVGQMIEAGEPTFCILYRRRGVILEGSFRRCTSHR